MNKILIFKTSSDTTMYRLLDEMKYKNIDCLIQSSQVERYREKYCNVNFIDIQREGFYELPAWILQEISEKKYDEIYITFSGIVGHNYGNVVEILQKLSFKKAFFYNCDGCRVVIPRPNVIKDIFCKMFIKIIEILY